MKFTLSVILVYLFSLIFISCERPEKIPPQLYSGENFELDFSDFEGFENGETNCQNANLQIESWDKLLKDSSTLCLNAFAEFGMQEPEYQAEMQWLWKCDFNLGDSLYHSKLLGLTENDTVIWEQYISYDTLITDYHRASGLEYTADDSAKWIIHKHPLSETAGDLYFFTQKTASGTLKKFTLGSNSVCETDSLKDDFNRYWQIISDTDTCHIFINTSTNAGQIQSKSLYSDTKWHCWDDNLKDLNCAEK